MTREAELRARDFVSLVSGGVHAETEVGVAQRLLLQAQTALGCYAEPGWARERGWPQFADRLLELAREAEPGSDHQLAYINSLCSSVLSPRHVQTLGALLEGEPAACGLAGLAVDTDLRWRIVTALATAGAIDADGPETPRIDAEVQRDPTAAGKRHAAQARAARPQFVVKDEAFTTVVEDDTLANATGRAMIAGIAAPGQGELLKPFARRYFQAIPGVWARRSGEVAQSVVIGLYPHWDISEQGIAPPRSSSATPRFRPHCAGWCSRARPRCSDRCGPATSTLTASPHREGACLYNDTPHRAYIRACSPGQPGAIPALSTRIALISPSTSSPCSNAEEAAATPSGAADSAPRPRTCEP